MANTGKSPTSSTAENGHKGEGFSLISNEKLLALYTAMLRSRLLAERVRRDGENDFELTLGHEAAVAGVAIDLRDGDVVVASEKSTLPAFIKGVPLDRIVAGASGAASDGTGRNGRAGRRTIDLSPWNVFLRSAKSGEVLDVAVRVGLESKVKSAGQIVAVFCVDGEHRSETWREALSFAGERELPILFVCQEMSAANHFGSPKRDDVSVKERAFGVPAISVDGNDAVAVYRVASESISRARMGRGPTLIDCRRFLVSAAGKKAAKTTRPLNGGLNGGRIGDVVKDVDDEPIANMERYLGRKGLFREEQKAALLTKFGRELEAAFGRGQSRVGPKAGK